MISDADCAFIGSDELMRDSVKRVVSLMGQHPETFFSEPSEKDLVFAGSQAWGVAIDHWQKMRVSRPNLMVMGIRSRALGFVAEIIGRLCVTTALKILRKYALTYRMCHSNLTDCLKSAQMVSSEC